MTLTIGVDVGGTKIAAGLVDEAGRIVARERRESPASDSAAIEDTIADLVRQISTGIEVAGVGVAAAGFVSADQSTVLFAPNLAWRNEPLKSELERRLALPVVVENDANAAAWGEFEFGAGSEVEDLLLVTVGTGVGGGIVLDGRLYRGAAGIAAEIGHIRVVPGGRQCGCGNRGCWEQYASGTALVRDVRMRAQEDPSAASLLLARAGDEVQAITGPMVTAAAQDGDPFAVKQLELLAGWLGDGIATLTAVLDPAVIVVGGGVAEAGDLLINPLCERFLQQLTGREQRPAPAVKLAELGNDAGLIGAAGLARRLVDQSH